MTSNLAVDADGDPVWSYAAGDVVVPGALAWQRLGVGRRCETWLCWSTDRWHPVVAKFPRPHQADHPRARAAVTREATALAAVHHPALPGLVDDGSAAERPYVVTEHVDGLTLDEELDDQGPLDPVSAAHLAATLLSALRLLHRAGLAHLDVKPENIVLRDGRPVLVDLGSARPIGRPQPPGHPVGTEGWSAPEMEECRPIAASMDVFGVGMVLREVLGGGADGPVAEVAEVLIGPDPANRASADDALERLARAAGPGVLWPVWARTLVGGGRIRP